MKSDVLATIEQIKSGLPRAALSGLLSDRNQSVRGSAVQSLVERFGNDAAVVSDLKRFIEEPENRKPAMGTISLSHLAMKLLAEVELPEARSVFESLKAAWPESDLADLQWFLSHG
jgi:hypothetical protein